MKLYSPWATVNFYPQDIHLKCKGFQELKAWGFIGQFLEWGSHDLAEKVLKVVINTHKNKPIQGL